MSALFPDEFSDLTRFADWAQPTELRRNQKRWRATWEESREFYDVMLERAPEALSYLNRFDLAGLDPQQTRLLDLCLALAEVSATVEMYEEPQPKYVFPIERFEPVHDGWTRPANGRARP